MSCAHPYLDSLNNFEFHLQDIKPEDFHLGRLKQALAELGNPQDGLKVIHVAGTKGKGSTCMMIASILAKAGYKVGLFTSPHLHRVNERIRIIDNNAFENQEDFPGSISDDNLKRLIEKIRPVITQIEHKKSFITYFEALTMAAALYFQENQVDWVILETGLGGRLDATNVFDSTIVLLTPISLDHTRILGERLSEISKEKAGIIKSSHQKVVIAPQDAEALAVIKERCREFGIQPRLVKLEDASQVAVSLKGDHQKVNAACAFEAIRCLQELGVDIHPQAISQGFQSVRWQGRFEIIHQKPTVVIDGAHNLAAVQALAKTMRDEYRHQKVFLILGFSQDKNIEEACQHLSLISQCILLTRANHPRAHRFNYLEASRIFPGKDIQITDNIKEALEAAFSKAHQDDVILVTGSLFIVAEARTCINSKV